MSRSHTAGALALTAVGALSLSLLGQAPSFATDVDGPAWRPLVSLGDLYAYSYSYGGDCGNGDNGDNGQETSEPVTPDGGPTTHSSSVTRTFTHPENPDDVTEGTSSSTGTSSVSTRKDGSLRVIRYRGTSETDVTRPADSRCNTSYYTHTRSQVRFTLTEASFVTIRAVNDSPAGFVEGYVHAMDQNNDWYGWQHVGGYGQGTRFDNRSTVFLPAGEYLANSAQGARDYYYENQHRISEASSTGSVTMRVHKAGNRLATLNDEGRRFVDLPRGRDCASDQLAVEFKDNANRVRKAQFVVNGELAKSVKAPEAGQSVTLDGLDQGSKKSVVQVLVTRKPAHSGGTAPTAYLERSYAPCS